MKIRTEKMPVGYAIMWVIFTAIYDVWMIFFMKHDTYPPAETGILKPIYFPIWIAASTVFMLLYAFYIKKFLYDKETKGDKIFCMINLVFALVFITWYGFFKNPFDYTASMIGLEYPWHFKMWGIFAPLAVFTNMLYMYRKYDYYSRIGVIAGSIGCAAMFVTINVPSAGEDLILTSLRCMSHWTGALVFAFCGATPVVIFLLNRARTKNTMFVITAVVFIAILALMLILLATVGKDGVIESLPMWAVYIILFLINFTPLYKSKEVKASKKEMAVK